MTGRTAGFRNGRARPGAARAHRRRCPGASGAGLPPAPAGGAVPAPFRGALRGALRGLGGGLVLALFLASLFLAFGGGAALGAGQGVPRAAEPVAAGEPAPAAAQGQGFSALARVIPEGSLLRDSGAASELTLLLSQPVPYRLFTLDGPRRLVIDFHEVDWSGFDARAFDRSQAVGAVRTGVVRPGWSRMVLDLTRPMRVETAALLSRPADGRARVVLRLEPTDAEAYAATAGAPAGALLPVPEPPAPAPGRAEGRLRVVLDPGHGGIDPGAERAGVSEADLMLTFARELRDVLRRTGRFEVALTRDSDIFVPLETRVAIAHRSGADVFLSLHADALIEGRASGSTVYTLSGTASDAASRKLAERHDRADLLAGVDLSGQDDVIALVLMDMARIETAPRSESLARALVEGLRATVGTHKRPHLRAGFSVLKAPDIPSALIEIGFLSSPRDRSRLLDADWRARAAAGIRDGLLRWADADAAEAPLRRR